MEQLIEQLESEFGLIEIHAHAVIETVENYLRKYDKHYRTNAYKFKRKTNSVSLNSKQAKLTLLNNNGNKVC